MAELVRTQIYLSGEQQQRLADLSRRTLQNKSSLIRDAIDRLLDAEQEATQAQSAKKQRLASLAGVWAHHDDGLMASEPGAGLRKLRSGWSRRTA